jgi:hypothetical protein
MTKRIVVLSIMLILMSNLILTGCQSTPASAPTVPAQAQAKEPATGSGTQHFLAGKTVWIVDINTNEYYTSLIQPALLNQLQRQVPGVKVRQVTTSAKGNPFYLLRQEDYPDAAIVSLGVCDSTTKDVANYASEARKKGIPSVTIHMAEARDAQMKWNKTYSIPDEKALEIEKRPQDQQEAILMAERLMPTIIESLKQ